MGKLYPIYGFGLELDSLYKNGVLDEKKKDAVAKNGSFLEWALDGGNCCLPVKGKDVTLYTCVDYGKEHCRTFLMFCQPFLFFLSDEAKQNACSITKHDIALAMAKLLKDWLLVPIRTAVARIEKELDVIETVGQKPN